MRRLHLIELHDQPWYPEKWRQIFLDSLGRSMSLTGSMESFAALFQELIDRTKPSGIFDLCSGSGETAKLVWDELSEAAGGKPPLLLSDLFPSAEAFEELQSAAGSGRIEFIAEPVDALDPPLGPEQVVTLLNCFHHFRPDDAATILAKVSKRCKGIAIFEITGNTLKNQLAALLILPLAAVILTAFALRPLRFRNILWGLLIPVVPLTAVWDSLVSNWRTYTVEELRTMTQAADCQAFDWQIGTLKVPSTRVEASYVLGWRKDLSPDPGRPS